MELGLEPSMLSRMGPRKDHSFQSSILIRRISSGNRSLIIGQSPQEAAPELVWYLEYLPEGVREEIENEVKQIAQIVERAKLSQAEKRNPVLYKDIDELDEQFYERSFLKQEQKHCF